MILFSAVSALAETKICEHITLVDGSLRLNANERILICGSSQGPEGWRSIPLPQAQLHITGLLQNLGYLHPRFERNKEKLRVWQGELTRTKELRFEGDLSSLNPSKKRKVIGHPLTPEKLEEVKNWTELVLKTHGRACPQFSLVGEGWANRIRVNVQTQGRQKIADLQIGDLQGLNPKALVKYQPFRVGDIYNIQKTQLMAQRMTADGLFESVYFLTDCREHEVGLQLKSMIGRPRLFRFGIGASTEEFPFVDVSVRNSRLDEMASSFTAVVHASPRRQSLNLDSEIYFSPDFPRTFFGPKFRTEHREENAYSLNSAQIGADLGNRGDLEDVRWLMRVGPTLNYSKTLSGIGPGDTGYYATEGSILLMSHPFEIGLRDQFEGWTAGLRYRGQRQGLGSQFYADRFDINYKTLWNVGEYAPPLFILGTRVQLTAVDIDALDGTDRRLLPLEYPVFLGGDESLRGFGRESISNDGLGYLTAAYIGWELRLIGELPFRLEPFLLFDLARAGVREWTLDAAVYSSEGLGMRWASPIGTLRGSVARGQSTDARQSSGIVYFLSMGQEF